MTFLLALVPLMNTVVLLGGIVFFSRQGGPTAAKAIIDLKNEQIKTYEDKLAQLGQDMQNREDTHRLELQKREDAHHAEMQELHTRMGQIEGQLRAKDSELERLTAIFQNRDPQSTEITVAASKYISVSLPI